MNGIGRARLIALDWGSSSLRAFLMGAAEASGAAPDAGVVIARRDGTQGASRLAGDARQFAQALHELIGDWRAADPSLPLLACGMVGSAHGWREAPYVTCPADTSGLHAQAVPVALGDGASMLILPGLLHRPPQGAPDVMRGEETQIAGVLALRPALAAGCCIVLPGTHSKWALLRDGRVTAFATRMTGELYAVLRQHSVLGRLMAGDGGVDALRESPAADATSHQQAAFDAGLAAAVAGGGRDLGRQLFAVRTLGLFGQWPDYALGDYLSGLLIGHELLAGLADADEGGEDDEAGRAGHGPGAALPLVLVGEAGLCARYRHALQRLGRPPTAVLDNTAPAGLWQQACAAGLVSTQ